MTESNKLGEPIWFKGYSMKEAYGLSSMKASEFLNLGLSFETNEELFGTFEYNYKGGYPYGGLDKNATICHVISATMDEYSYCTLHMYPSKLDPDFWNGDYPE